MRVREVLSLLQHPSVPLDALLYPGSQVTVQRLMELYSDATEDQLDEPFVLDDGAEVVAVYCGETRLRMSDPA